MPLTENFNLSATVKLISKVFFVSWDDVQGHQIGNPLEEEETEKGGGNFFQSIIFVHATLAQKGNP